MFPNTADLLLKQRITLYNNVAKVPNCECRLLAELEVYPTPRIIWELEVLGAEGQNFSHARISKLRPLEGIFFSIPEPVFTGYLGNVVGLVKTTPTGLAPKAFYKGEKDEANAFLFYLPNTRFQFISDNQCYLQNRGLGQGAEGKYIDASIDETWSIRLKILKDSLEWLEPRKRNIGTLITSVGELYQPKFKIEESQSVSHLQAISLDCALERLKTLSWLGASHLCKDS